MRRQLLESGVIVVNCETDLLEIIAATHPPRGLTGGLNRRQQQPHENANDGDDDEQFHECETDVSNLISFHVILKRAGRKKISIFWGFRAPTRQERRERKSRTRAERKNCAVVELLVTAFNLGSRIRIRIRVHISSNIAPVPTTGAVPPLSAQPARKRTTRIAINNTYFILSLRVTKPSRSVSRWSKESRAFRQTGHACSILLENGSSVRTYTEKECGFASRRLAQHARPPLDRRPLPQRGRAAFRRHHAPS